MSSVWAAPVLRRRLGAVPALGVALALVAADLVALGLGAESRALIVAVVVAGAFLGVVNTLLTEMVMHVAPVERPVASAAYSFVRLTGGAVAPFLAGKLAEHIAPDIPFFVGAAAVAIAVGVLAAGRAHLRAALHAPEPAPAAA